PSSPSPITSAPANRPPQTSANGPSTTWCGWRSAPSPRTPESFVRIPTGASGDVVCPYHHTGREDMGLLDTIKGWFSSEKVSEVADKATEKAGAAWEKTKDIAEDVADKAGDVAEGAWEKTKDIADKAGDA